MGAGQSGSLEIDGSTMGYQVLRVYPNSPGSRAGLKAYFDFIVAIGNTRFSRENGQLRELLKASVDQKIKTVVYNTRDKCCREVEITPSTNWGGNGLLGVSIKHSSFDKADERVWHVVEVENGSPALQAGLKAGEDYIIGSDSILQESDDLYNLIEAHESKALKLFVYNVNSDNCREVVCYPNSKWGGKGYIGCEFGHGLLHRIPTGPPQHQGSLSAPSPQPVPSPSIPASQFQDLFQHPPPRAPPQQPQQQPQQQSQQPVQPPQQHYLQQHQQPPQQSQQPLQAPPLPPKQQIQHLPQPQQYQQQQQQPARPPPPHPSPPLQQPPQQQKPSRPPPSPPSPHLQQPPQQQQHQYEPQQQQQHQQLYQQQLNYQQFASTHSAYPPPPPQPPQPQAPPGWWAACPPGPNAGSGDQPATNKPQLSFGPSPIVPTRQGPVGAFAGSESPSSISPQPATLGPQDSYLSSLSMLPPPAELSQSLSGLSLQQQLPTSNITFGALLAGHSEPSLSPPPQQPPQDPPQQHQQQQQQQQQQ